VKATAILGEGGGLQHVVDIFHDMTVRRSLEEQYRQAQKMEAVGRLAGGIAHDFNNLLTVITGYGEMLLEKLPADDASREPIQAITTAGDRAASLTRQLLAFSRKAILEPKVLDLKAIVKDMDKMLRRIIGEDIQMATVGDAEPGLVKADAGQIEQVLLNLAVNARDAMPRGGRLTIEVRNADSSEVCARFQADVCRGPHVMLSVSDTGCGMDKETMARIFEPFFTTKGENGTGLGLATVYGIVKHSGGQVLVSSEPGGGTTFEVYLPCTRETACSAITNPSVSAMGRGTETVLLAEDEDGVRKLTSQVLQGCGYTILEACDGAEALRIAHDYRGRIDLLLTDVVMPRLGGPALAELLALTRPEMRVLFLSGHIDDAVVRHGIQAQDVAFLQKPFKLQSIAAKVREILDAR